MTSSAFGVPLADREVTKSIDMDWSSTSHAITRNLQAVEAEGTNTEASEGGQTTDETEPDHKGKKSWLNKTIEGLGYSFWFIFLSEIGDKTFLFVVLYATRMNGMKLLIISSIGL